MVLIKTKNSRGKLDNEKKIIVERLSETVQPSSPGPSSPLNTTKKHRYTLGNGYVFIGALSPVNGGHFSSIN